MANATRGTPCLVVSAPLTLVRLDDTLKCLQGYRTSKGTHESTSLRMGPFRWVLLRRLPPSGGAD